ncbi:uncharacterized protein OCT59_025291 [Rhizophagus irregularis]|uniref:uncharacterized protein n=1 Tax=Rhizophagus irregularis TaxID=588596 RepID=UPI00332FFB6F|nr:hypothetical protein OCT59_025291 [Rhizophagus irregularis]
MEKNLENEYIHYFKYDEFKIDEEEIDGSFKLLWETFWRFFCISCGKLNFFFLSLFLDRSGLWMCDIFDVMFFSFFRFHVSILLFQMSEPFDM